MRTLLPCELRSYIPVDNETNAATMEVWKREAMRLAERLETILKKGGSFPDGVGFRMEPNHYLGKYERTDQRFHEISNTTRVQASLPLAVI